MLEREEFETFFPSRNRLANNQNFFFQLEPELLPSFASCVVLQPSDEEEVVAVLLKKICSLFGIKYAVEKETPEADGSNIPQNSI